MKLILRNQWFRIAVGCIIAQQVLIGLSTYYIGSAGRAVSDADQGKMLHSIVLFFASVAMAYLLGGTVNGSPRASRMTHGENMLLACWEKLVAIHSSPPRRIKY
jgi:hypothetical protein